MFVCERAADVAEVNRLRPRLNMAITTVTTAYALSALTRSAKHALSNK